MAAAVEEEDFVKDLCAGGEQAQGTDTYKNVYNIPH